MRVERLVAHLLRRGVEHRRVPDRVESEAAEVLSQMAPGVEVPGVAVVHQTLRRDLALERLTACAVVVAQRQASPLPQRTRDLAEPRAGRAGRLAEDAYPARHLAAADVLGREQLLDPLLDRRELAVEQAGLEPVQQLVRRGEGVQLAGVEPQAGQLEHATLRGVVTVAVAGAVVDDRRVQVVAHVLADALDGRARALQLLFEHPPGDGVAVRL